MPFPHRISLFTLPWLIASSLALANDTDVRGPEVTNLAVLTGAALSHYPSIRAKTYAIEAAEARRGEARVSPFFQWEATAGFTVVPDARGNAIYSNDSELPLGNSWGPAGSIGLEGVIPLYTFGRIRSAREAATAGVDAARHDRDRTLAAVRRDVRRAYFGLQFALDVRQMLSEGQGHLRRAVETLEQRIEEGDGSVDEMDRYRLAAAVAELDARDSQAHRLEASARAGLRVLTSFDDIRVPDCPMERVEFALEDIANYVEGASRPELAMLDALVRARSSQIRLQRAGFAPNLGIGFRASYNWAPGITDQDNPFIQDPANRSQLGASLVAQWSLDFWGNSYRVRRAEAERHVAELQREEARAGIEIEVITTYEQVSDAARREVAWREGHRQTRRWFIAAVQGYQVGTTEAETLIDAVKTYFENRFNHVQAIHDYNVAVAALEQVTGNVLVPDDGWEPVCEE